MLDGYLQEVRDACALEGASRSDRLADLLVAGLMDDRLSELEQEHLRAAVLAHAENQLVMVERALALFADLQPRASA